MGRIGGEGVAVSRSCTKTSVLAHPCDTLSRRCLPFSETDAPIQSLGPKPSPKTSRPVRSASPSRGDGCGCPTSDPAARSRSRCRLVERDAAIEGARQPIRQVVAASRRRARAVRSRPRRSCARRRRAAGRPSRRPRAVTLVVWSALSGCGSSRTSSLPRSPSRTKRIGSVGRPAAQEEIPAAALQRRPLRVLPGQRRQALANRSQIRKRVEQGVRVVVLRVDEGARLGGVLSSSQRYGSTISTPCSASFTSSRRVAGDWGRRARCTQKRQGERRRRQTAHETSRPSAATRGA